MRTLLLFVVLGLSGCDNLAPSDLPLPPPLALVGTFGAQAPGSGFVCEGELSRCGRRRAQEPATATYTTRSTVLGTVEFEIYLATAEAGVRLTKEVHPDSLVAGRRHGVGGFVGLVGSGNGYIWLTAAGPDRLEGVYAVDAANDNLFYPQYVRVLGAFNATFSDGTP